MDLGTDNIFKQKKYSKLDVIKGIAPLGSDIFALKHIIVDKIGNLIVDRC